MSREYYGILQFLLKSKRGKKKSSAKIALLLFKSLLEIACIIKMKPR